MDDPIFPQSKRHRELIGARQQAKTVLLNSLYTEKQKVCWDTKVLLSFSISDFWGKHNEKRENNVQRYSKKTAGLWEPSYKRKKY